LGPLGRLGRAVSEIISFGAGGVSLGTLGILCIVVYIGYLDIGAEVRNWGRAVLLFRLGRRGATWEIWGVLESLPCSMRFGSKVGFVLYDSVLRTIRRHDAILSILAAF